MHVIDLEKEEYMLQATYTVEGELNSNQSLSLKILPTKVNKVFIEDITEMWTVVDNNGVEYRVVYCKKKGEGNLMTVDIKGIPLFFDVLDNLREEYDLNEHMTAALAFNRIFEGTGFSFSLVDSFPAIQWEGFGAGGDETKLETFKRALNRYGAEFRISGSNVFLERRTGRDLSVMYRHRLNASNIVQENNAEEYWTFIRGYGDYEDGEDAGWKTAKLKREYTSPLEKIVGKRHAPPLKDGRRTDGDELYNAIKAIVDDSLKISVTANIHDLRKQGYPIAQTQLGDRVFIIDERIGLNDEVRIVNQSVTKNWRDEVIDITLTFGTESLTKRHQSKMKTAVKSISDILSGRKQMPLSALDRRVQEISNIINGNNDSVFKYLPNGVIGWNGDDPNYMTRYVGDAIGFSSDGGQTYGTAMSAKLGIVADYITTGTLRSIIVEAVEIYGSKIEGTDIGGVNFTGADMSLRNQLRLENEYSGVVGTYNYGPEDLQASYNPRYFIGGYRLGTNHLRFTADAYEALSGGERGTHLGYTETSYGSDYIAMRNYPSSRPGEKTMRRRVDISADRFQISDSWNETSGVFATPSGTLSAVNVRSRGPMFAHSSLDVTGSALIRSNFDVQGGAIMRNGLDLKGRLDVGSVLDVTGGSLFRSTTDTEGFATFRSGAYFTGSVTFNSSIRVDAEEIRFGTNGDGRIANGPSGTYIQSNLEVRATRFRSATLVPMVAREFNTSSSEDLKTNIHPYDGKGLDIVCGLNIVNFDWKESPEVGRQIGVIAENSPEISSSSGKEIKINDLVMYLVKSVQELHEEINILKGV